MSQLLKQRYLIIDELGRGGMGVVYKARDIQLGDRLVAVKEMGQNNPSQKAVDAFKGEAEMLACLMHPNLPSIHEHFAEAGCWYLVMEFIEGETLEDYVEAKGGWLPFREVLDIGIQLCTVLDYLHTRQPPIIFRDLKPLNVMRSPDGHLYLIDFGIARHFKLGNARDTSLALSVGYAAPEQYPLLHTQTTPQSDIYSLGAMLHRLLTENDPSSNTPTFFDFPPLQLHGQTAPASLETLIAQMVEKVTNKRPTSMAEVKAGLQRIAAQPIREMLLPPTQQKVSRRTVIIGLATLGLAAGGIGGLWWLTFAHPLYTYGDGQSPSSIAWSSDSKRIASTFGIGDNTNTVQVLNATDGGNVFSYRGHSNDVWAVAWSPDGRRIASASLDKTVQVWNATDGGNVFSYHGHSNDVWAVAWSPDSRRIASAGGNTYDANNDMSVQVWDASGEGNILKYRGHSNLVKSITWSPDGKFIASAGSNNIVQVWNATDGKPVYEYDKHSDAVTVVVWSPNGRRIASGSSDKTVQIWDATSGEQVFTYRGHSAGVNGVAWSPNGTRIVSGSDDSTIQFWDATDGSSAYTYRVGSPVGEVAWSPDGKYIASIGDKVEIWQSK